MVEVMHFFCDLFSEEALTIVYSPFGDPLLHVELDHMWFLRGESAGTSHWALLTRKRHTMPHSAQPRHTNYWAP